MAILKAKHKITIVFQNNILAAIRIHIMLSKNNTMRIIQNKKLVLKLFINK